jgi:WD40 repeat protein
MEKSAKGEEVLEALPPSEEEDSSELSKTDSSGSSSPKSDTSSATTYASAESKITTEQETLNNMSTSDAGTSTITDASSLTGQEKNQTSTTTFDAGINTDNDVLNSSTSQEQTQIPTSTSGAIADTNALSSTGQEQNQTITTTSGADIDTNNDALNSSTSQEQTQIPTSTSGAIADTNALSSTGQEQNQTITTTSGADIDTNNDVLNSSTSQEQTQIRTDAKTNAMSSNIDINTNTDAKTNAMSSNTIEEQTEIVEEENEIVEEQIEFVEEQTVFALIDMIPQGTEIIRSMALGLNDTLLTGYDNQIVREWHRGRQFSHFELSSPVYGIVLQYVQNPDTYACAFLAQNKGVISVRTITPIDGAFRPAWTLQKPCNRLQNLLFPWRGPRENVISCLCLSDDHRFIYSGSADCILTVWRTLDFSFNPVETIRGTHRGAIKTLAVGPDLVFSGSSDGVINMWKREKHGTNLDKVRHRLIWMFAIHDTRLPASINALVFRRLGVVAGWLYAGCSDGKVRCWRNLSLNESGPDVHEPEVMSYHKGEVTCLALCSDSFVVPAPLVFSGSADKTICVWRSEIEDTSHTIAIVLRGHLDVVTCIAAQNDWEVGTNGYCQWILYSGSLDRTLMVWRVYEPLLITTAARSRNLP